MKEEFTVAIYQKDKIYVLVGKESGGGLSFDNAIHLAQKFTREKAEMLKEIVQKKNPEWDVGIVQIRTFD